MMRLDASGSAPPSRYAAARPMVRPATASNCVEAVVDRPHLSCPRRRTRGQADPIVIEVHRLERGPGAFSLGSGRSGTIGAAVRPTDQLRI